MSSRCSQCDPQQLPDDVGWFSISTPSSVSQPKRSRPTETTRGVTILLTATPRSVPTASVVADGTIQLPLVPSGQLYPLVTAGSPSASRGVRGLPSSSRKRGHDDDAKPSAWSISCTAVLSCSPHSAASVETCDAQKCAWPKIGRSYWSRWHVEA